MAYSGIVRKTQARRHNRFPKSGTIGILWEDGDRRERVSNALIVNASTTGVMVRMDEKLPVRSYVVCNDIARSIAGRASVRYCNFSKGKYEIGLEFVGGSGFQEDKALSLKMATRD